MIQAPDDQKDPVGPQDEPAPQAPDPTLETPGDAEPAGRFGKLKQDALNRWTVRDREA